jgi:hypothetical protein
MSDLCRLIWCAVIGLFRSQAALQAEIVLLRHQLNVMRRRSPKRVNLSNIDRLVFAGIYSLAPQVLDALQIIKPETVIGWHRAGFRTYWRWKSRPRGGRPSTPHEIRQLIRDMSIANSLWAHHGSMVNFSSWELMSGRPRSPSTWQNIGGRQPRAGRRS